MSTEQMKVRYSQLDPTELKKELIKRYGLSEAISCRFFDFGMNDIYLVNVGDKKYYLRISLANMHNKKDYEEETYIIHSLTKHSLPVAAPIACIDGDFVWEINAPEGMRYAVLFQEAKNQPSEDSEARNYQLGETLGRIHQIADEENFHVSRLPIDNSTLVERPLSNLKPYLAHRESDYIFIEASAKASYAFIQQHLKVEKPYYGFCHGDIHNGNVFFVENTPQIFDFDCMGYGYRVYDLCTYLWNETFQNEDYKDSKEWKALLNGYNSIRKLSDNELSSVTAFAALRELWMMGLHADVMDRNAGCTWYNDGYFDYQIGIFKLWFHRWEKGIR